MKSIFKANYPQDSAIANEIHKVHEKEIQYSFVYNSSMLIFDLLFIWVKKQYFLNQKTTEKKRGINESLIWLLMQLIASIDLSRN